MADMKLLLELLADDKASRELHKVTGALGDMEGKSRMAGLAVAGAMTAIGAAVVGLGVAAFKLGEDFDAAYDKIRVGTGATGRDLEALQQNFRNVAAGVPDSFDKVSTAITEVSRRIKATDSTLDEMATTFLNLSRITGTDLNENVRLSARLFGDWAVATDDMTKTLDLMFRATQQSGIGLGNLQQLLVQFGAPLRTLGFSLTESIALLSKFEAEGVNTEQVMGSMRIAIGNLAEAGIPLKEGFRGVIQEIRDMDDPMEATSAAMKVFGTRAGVDMAGAIREGRFAIEELVEALEVGEESIASATRETEDGAEQMARAWNRVQLALEPVGEAIFTLAGAIATELGTVLEEIGPDIAAFIKSLNPETVAATGAAESGVATLGSAIRGLIDPIRNVINFLGQANTAFENVDRAAANFMKNVPLLSNAIQFGTWAAAGGNRGMYPPIGPEGPPGGAPATMTGPEMMQAQARAFAIQYGIPQDVFLRQIGQESGFNPAAVSPAGARGIGQFMPGTGAAVAARMRAQGINVSAEQIFGDAEAGMHAAAFHMRELLDQFGGDVALALAAYNAGPGNARAGVAGQIRETSTYLERILGGSRPTAAGGGRGGGGGGRAAAAPERMPETAIMGFMEEAVRATSQYEAEFGNLGGKLASSLSKALAENTKAGGADVRKSLDSVVTALREAEVPEWQEMGDELATALHDALVDGSPASQQAAQDLIRQFSETIKSAQFWAEWAKAGEASATKINVATQDTAAKITEAYRAAKERVQEIWDSLHMTRALEAAKAFVEQGIAEIQRQAGIVGGGRATAREGEDIARRRQREDEDAERQHRAALRGATGPGAGAARQAENLRYQQEIENRNRQRQREEEDMALRDRRRAEDAAHDRQLIDAVAEYRRNTEIALGISKTQLEDAQVARQIANIDATTKAAIDKFNAELGEITRIENEALEAMFGTLERKFGILHNDGGSGVADEALDGMRTDAEAALAAVQEAARIIGTMAKPKTGDGESEGGGEGAGDPYAPGGPLNHADYDEYQRGGVVRHTGLALVHKGETVLPAGGAGVTVNINAPVYGIEDLNTQIVNAVRMADRTGSLRLVGR